MVARMAALVCLWRRRCVAVDVFPSDMLFWCAGSLAVAWGMWRRKPWAATLAWVLCGAIAVSVLHAATLAMHARAGWSGVLLMVPALILTVFFAWHSTRAA